jgi:hypothetical protein
VGAAEASGQILAGPGQQIYVAPVTGEYAITVLGAAGGTFLFIVGGSGAELTGDVFVHAGQLFDLVAGGQGYVGGGGESSGGGGFSFVSGFTTQGSPGLNFFAVAGGGGGGGFNGRGGPGQAAPNGHAGYGTDGGLGGQNGSGGGGGTYLGGPFSGANGGGGTGYFGGGGSGAGNNSGGGGGGGSAFSGPIFDQKSYAGVNGGEGYASVRLLTAVPEPSTWVMALAGFAGLGWLARMRKRKLDAQSQACARVD